MDHIKNMTAEDVKAWVLNMGKAFQPYGEDLLDCRISGEDLLEDFDTIWEDISFKNNTQRNKFKREWEKKLKTQTSTPHQTPSETPTPCELTEPCQEAVVGKKCSICTYINHKARTRCEICGNELSQLPGSREKKTEIATEGGGGRVHVSQPGAMISDNPVSSIQHRNPRILQEQEGQTTDEELKELLFFFFQNRWDVSHIELALEKYPESEREVVRLQLYREFRENGPYHLHYLTDDLHKKKAYPKDGSPKPPNFDAMSEKQLSEFCRRLNIYTGDITISIGPLRERLREFEIGEEKHEHAGHMLSSVEDAYEKYKEVLTELWAIADAMKDLEIPLNSQAELSEDFQKDFKKCRNLRELLRKKDPSIFVFGDTSAGKSTFINLLIESELLPSSVRTGLTTAVCQLIGIRDPKKARIDAVLKNGGFALKKQLNPENIAESHAAIRQFAAEDNAEDPQFKKVDIWWPCELLNSGVSLVDSPGLNYAIHDEQISYWWIDKVREHVKESIATICILTPPGVLETVAECLRLLVQTQGENGTYQPASIFFVVTHLDQLSDIKEQEEVMDDIKRTLKKLVPGCPLDTNVVKINLLAAANARRWNLCSPEHLKLILSLRHYFVSCFKFYLVHNYEILYSPVYRIYERIHDHLHYQGIKTEKERRKQEQELQKRKRDLLKINALYAKRKKEYERDIDKLKKKIYSDIRARLDKKRDDILQKTVKVDISKMADEDGDETKESLTDEEPNKIALYFEAMGRLMKREVYDLIAEMSDELDVKITQIIEKYAIDVYSEVQKLQHKMLPDGIEVLGLHIKDMIPDTSALSATARLGILAGAGVTVAAVSLILGVATTVVVPVAGVGIAAVALLFAVPYLAKKAYEKHKKLKAMETVLYIHYEELLKEEKITEMVEDFSFLSRLSDQVFDCIRTEISDMDNRIHSQECLLNSPKSCQKLEDLNEIKIRMNSIQNSLLLIKYKHLTEPDFENPTVDEVAELPSGPLGSEYKQEDSHRYEVHHCLMQKCAHQEGKEDEKEEPMNQHVIVKAYNMDSHNAALIFQDDWRLLGKIKPHQHLATFHGFSKTECQLQLISEYLEGGSLFDWMDQHDKLTAIDLTDVAIGIALGMDDLGRQGHVHGNLRPENIMISHQDETKLVKVGRHYTPSSTVRSVAALRYQPPEIILRSKVEKQFLSDVYSFGVILWEMWHRATPFSEIVTLDKFAAVIVDGRRPQFYGAVPQDIRDLCRICWATNCADRPSWRKIVETLVMAKQKMYDDSKML